MKMVLGQVDNQERRKESLDSYLTPHAKLHSKGLDLKVRIQTIILQEENRRKTLGTLG